MNFAMSTVLSRFGASSHAVWVVGFAKGLAVARRWKSPARGSFSPSG
jgi:hypothetical protein